MNGAGTSTSHAEVQETRTMKVATGGSVVEAIVGISAVVLALIGLAKILPADMAAVATIAIGASLLFEGGAVAASYRQVAGGTDSTAAADLGGAMTVEFLGGFAGVILGILALLGIQAPTLVSTAVIVFGASLLLSSTGTTQFGSYSAGQSYAEERNWQMAREAASAAAGGKVLIGLSAVVLGILAVLGINSQVLTLVAFLVLGVSVLLSGSAISSRMMSSLRW
jgi:hypothetical protein